MEAIECGKMKTLNIAGTITAKSPIHHGGDESTGNSSTLRRTKFLVGEEVIEIPVISGNSIRGILRRLLMKHMLDTIDYTLESLKTYHMIFAGGTLESVSSGDAGSLNMELTKRIRKNIPALSLLGTAIGNQMPAGKLKVGFAIPQCQELGSGNIPINELLDDIFATRHDDMMSETGEADQQMIYHTECFATGTVFDHKFVITDYNDIEESALYTAIELLKANPYLGGKSSTGYGQITLDYGCESNDKYVKFLTKNKKDIVEEIKWLEGYLG